MARPGPRSIRKYSDELKLTAVHLGQQPGIQVRTAAASSVESVTNVFIRVAVSATACSHRRLH